MLTINGYHENLTGGMESHIFKVSPLTREADTTIQSPPAAPKSSKQNKSGNRKRKRIQDGGNDDTSANTEAPPVVRSLFSKTQVAQLEGRFREQSFLSKEERVELAEEVGISERQVMIWFQNRRGRLKKRGPADGAYNPAKLQEINVRRPYPFLCGVISNQHQYRQNPVGTTFSGTQQPFSVYPKEVRSHIDTVVPHLPATGRHHVTQMTRDAQHKLAGKEDVEPSTPPPNVTVFDMQSRNACSVSQSSCAEINRNLGSGMMPTIPFSTAASLQQRPSYPLQAVPQFVPISETKYPPINHAQKEISPNPHNGSSKPCINDTLKPYHAPTDFDHNESFTHILNSITHDTFDPISTLSETTPDSTKPDEASPPREKRMKSADDKSQSLATNQSALPACQNGQSSLANNFPASHWSPPFTSPFSIASLTSSFSAVPVTTNQIAAPSTPYSHWPAQTLQQSFTPSSEYMQQRNAYGQLANPYGYHAYTGYPVSGQYGVQSQVIR